MKMHSFIKEKLARLRADGLERRLTAIEGPVGPRVVIDGQERLLMCSNDYLGLANHPEVVGAATEALSRYGAGAGASRLVSGTMVPHREIEERISSFLSTERALLFNSGYNANLALISTLAGRSTEVFTDRLNHASIVDGCVLSRAKVKRYASCDPDALERLLEKSTARKKLIITEGVFSMDGRIAPLREISALADRFGALLMLDDAHAVGVLGKRGTGTPEHLGMKETGIIRMGTLGKAFGAFGAFVAGSAELIELLTSRARPFIYTTALPPAVAAAGAKAIDIAEGADVLRKTLKENHTYLREGLKQAGLDTLKSTTQIIPVLVGGARETMEISSRLLARGVFIQGIRPPTVPAKTARLRVTVTAAHTRDDLDAALSAIIGAFKEAGVGADA